MSAIRRPLDQWVLACLAASVALMAGIVSVFQPVLSLVFALAFIGTVLAYGLITWFKSPTIPILLLCGFGALPGFVRTPVLSLSALITLLVMVLLCGYLLSLPEAVERVDWLWAIFLFWAFGVTIITRGFSQGAIQNLSVYISFFLIMALARAHFSSGILTYQALHKAMIGFAILAPIIYWIPSEFFGMSSTRGFALAALVPICWFSSRWRRLVSLDGLIVVSLSLILLSTLSRTALATALLVIVISRVDVHSFISLLRVVGSGLIVGAIGLYMVTRVESLNNRFFTGDMTLNVAGIPINATGRTNLWDVTLESIGHSWWTYWVGQGAGSASSVIERIRPGLGHPHNDFLRIWHDLGIAGLVLWICVLISLIFVIVKRWRDSEETSNVPTAWIHRPGFLAVLALIPPMFTDNVIVYYYAMLPSAILIGVAQASKINAKACDIRACPT